MESVVVSFNVDSDSLERARRVAEKLDTPLENILSAFLEELSNTQKIAFTTIEPMSSKMERLLAQAEQDVAAGRISGPFSTVEEFLASLK